MPLLASAGKVTTGARNTALGAGAGSSITTGSDNVIIGAQSFGVATENGVIRIGNGVFQKKAFIAGVSGVTTGLSGATAVFIDANSQLGTIKSSQAFKEDIHTLADASERIYTLRSVSFRYKEPYQDGSKPIQCGLIAEDVASVFPELVVYDAQGKPETVAYHLLGSLLLNEVQKGRKLAEAQARRPPPADGLGESPLVTPSRQRSRPRRHPRPMRNPRLPFRKRADTRRRRCRSAGRR